MTRRLSPGFWFLTAGIFVVNAWAFAVNDVALVAVLCALTGMGAVGVGLMEARVRKG